MLGNFLSRRFLDVALGNRGEEVVVVRQARERGSMDPRRIHGKELVYVRRQLIARWNTSSDDACSMRRSQRVGG